jgi:hypothetical protein
MRIQIAPKNSTSTLAHCFNSRGYRTYWREFGVHFMFGCALFGLMEEKGNRKVAFFIACILENGGENHNCREN